MAAEKETSIILVWICKIDRLDKGETGYWPVFYTA